MRTKIVQIYSALMVKVESVELSRAPGTSLHRQLYLVLRDGLCSKIWSPGSALPAESALSLQFSVSRVTVRRALADLASDGLVEKRQGAGTYVVDNAAAQRVGPTLTMIEELRQAATDTQVTVVEYERKPPPTHIAQMMQLATDELAVHAVRLRRSGAIPVLLTDAWIPQRLARGVTAAALRKRAMYELLLAQDVVFGRVLQEVGAEAAAPQRAELLQTDVGAPLVRVVRLLHDDSSRPVQHITVFFSPERSRMLMDVPGAAMNTLSAGQFVHDGVASTARR